MEAPCLRGSVNLDCDLRNLVFPAEEEGEALSALVVEAVEEVTLVVVERVPEEAVEGMSVVEERVPK